MRTLKHRLPVFVTSTLLLGLISGCFGKSPDKSRIDSINGVNLSPGQTQTIPVHKGKVFVSNPDSIYFISDRDYTGLISFPYTISDGRNSHNAVATGIVIDTNLSTDVSKFNYETRFAVSKNSTTLIDKLLMNIDPIGQTHSLETVGSSYGLFPNLRIYDFIIFFSGLTGTVLGWRALQGASKCIDDYREQASLYNDRLDYLGSSLLTTSGSFMRIATQINILEKKLLDLEVELAATRSSMASFQQDQPHPTSVDPYSTSPNPTQQPSFSIHNTNQRISASSTPQPQPPSSVFYDFDSPPNPQSSAQKQTQVTAAFNSGDRQTIRTETTALLNITTESENAIAMGQSVKTELQEESAGGSYCLVQISGEAWLYPSEQTLRSFSQYQPAKGVFEFIRKAVHSPQILSPALIVKNGSVWRVEQLGRIAIPG